MRQLPHLKRNQRSGNWIYFRRSPSRVAAITGRTFFEKSLRTSDKRAIYAAWGIANTEFEAKVERVLRSPANIIDASQNAKPYWLQSRIDIEPWNGDLQSNFQILDLPLGRIKQIISDWCQAERYKRAQTFLNSGADECSAEDFDAEFKIVGACGRDENWIFISPNSLSIALNC